MHVNNLFSKTRRDVTGESKNYNQLVKAGYVEQLMAGVYTYLPLGLIVLKKIEEIIREEMKTLGGEEILMPALHPKENWEKTGRWDSMDDLYRFKSYYSKNEMALGPTHEEIITPLAKRFISSYKDLPKYVFQIQTKFRDEKRPRSGLLRMREFLMKDLYSFHRDVNDLDNYYEKVQKSYHKIFSRMGIGDLTVLTYASGGTFSKYSHEFQTISDEGEDTIFLCEKCRVAINKEIINEQKLCPVCNQKNLKETRGIEVGNIFKLKDKFSKTFDLTYKDQDGQDQLVQMGCYGLGPARIMGTIVEVLSDEAGLVWPKKITPYQVYLVDLDFSKAKELVAIFEKEKISFLWDDRKESPGVKFADADLSGIPIRIIASEKSVKAGGFELKYRSKEKAIILPKEKIIKEVKEFYV